MKASRPELNNQDKRAQVSLRATVIGLIANILLAASKIIVGSLTHSVAVTADGFNNLTDTGAVLVSFISLRIARKPRDKEHPFGHGRMEYIGSLVIAVLILYIGMDLFRTGIEAIRNPQAPLFGWTALIVTAFSIPVKVFLYYYYRKNGKAHAIDTLIAASQDSFNDVITTSAIVAGLLLSHFYGILVDGYLGLGVSLLIIWSGIQIMRDTVNRLIGGKPDQALGSEAIRILLSRPEIRDIHDFVLHDYGPGRAFASVHAEVDADWDILAIHEVIDQAEREIMEKLNLPINIHIDPVVEDEMAEGSPGHAISVYLAGFDPPLTLHDFRMVRGKKVIKLLFDVLVPVNTKQSDEDILKDIADYAKSLDPRYRAIISIDHDYFNQTEQTED